MRKISEQQKNDVVTLYQETKLQIYQIAKMCDVSVASVTNIINQKGVSPKRRERVDIDKLERALSMYELGYRIREILSQCEIPESQLYSEIDARGIERRKNISTRHRKCRRHPKINQMLELYQEEKSISEIAKELDISTDTVKRNVVKAISNGEVEISERYLKTEEELLDSIAAAIVKSRKKVIIRDVAKAFQVDEKKLYYRVVKQKRNNNETSRK